MSFDRIGDVLVRGVVELIALSLLVGLVVGAFVGWVML